MFVFLFLWILFSPAKISDSNQLRSYFIIWNVGQGQWTTFSNLDNCYHFDLGGEFFPLKKLRKKCYLKNNHLYISHWDSDHMSALRFLKKWPQVCREEDPIGTAKESKQNLLNEFGLCKKVKDQVRKNITDLVGGKNQISDKNDTNFLRIEKIFPLGIEESSLPDISNAKSKVYLVNNWLVSGDSRAEEEILWAHRLTKKSVKGFVIGHHGSKTSNSEYLVSRLPALKWAIASSRWRRYKHPHPSVINNFKKYNKRVLRTEDWGNFFFEL